MNFISSIITLIETADQIALRRSTEHHFVDCASLRIQVFTSQRGGVRSEVQ